MAPNIPLIIYSFIFCIYIIGASLISYHLYFFGIGKAPKVILIIFLIGSAILLGFSVLAYSKVDWSIVNEYLMQNTNNFNFEI